MSSAIEEIFARAGCSGQLCVQSVDGVHEIALNADTPAVTASVFKVPVAIVAETQFATGRIDPRERVTLRSAERCPGPIGFSLFQHDVEASLRDLVIAMLTISDNDATDALLRRVGIETVNTTCARLGLTGTVVTDYERPIVLSIALEAGFADWDSMWERAAQKLTPEEEDDLVRRMTAASALVPERTTRSTARDMATLLRLIWSDQAGPPPACKRVRDLMHQQLTRHRLAAAFPAPARVAAKSGSLIGVVRNEVGVIEYPDGRAYAAAVFARSHRPWKNDAAINAAIGAAAAAAVSELSGQSSPIDAS
jgi:beta-lactamase class A